MTIDDKMKEKIEQAAKTRVLDHHFHFDLHRILEEDKEEALDQYVSFLVRGKENIDFEGKLGGIGNIYTGSTTYRKLLDLINNPDLLYFEKSISMHLTESSD